MERLGGRLAIAGIAPLLAIGILAGCGVLVALPGLPQARTVQIPDRDWNPPDPVKLEFGGLSFSAPSFNPSTDSVTLQAHVSKVAHIESSIIAASGERTVRSFN